MSSSGQVVSGWTTYEIAIPDGKGGYILPVDSALGISVTLAVQPLTKMQKVQELGWPEARTLKHDGKNVIVRADKLKDPLLWELKVSPSCWRLYFGVWEARKGIVYLHAICKKEWKQDDGEAAKARSVYDRLGAGDYQLSELSFPTS